MIVTVSQKNKNNETISSFYRGVHRIARGIVAEDVILYFKDDGGQFFPHEDYRTENIGGSIKIKNATIISVDEEVKKMKDWNARQKIAFIKIQILLAELGLSNLEVAEMFSTFKTKEEVFTHFQFTTSRWRIKELEKEIQE